MAIILGLNDERRQLLDTLSRAAASYGDFEARQKRMAADPPDRMALWRPLAELGLQGLTFSEAQGGFGGAPEDMAVMQEALAEVLPLEPFLTTAVTCGRILAQSDTPRAGALVERIIAGDAVLALAHRGGFDPFAAPAVRATRKGEQFVLDGRLPAVRHADVADTLLVGAVDAAGEVVILACPADATGLTAEALRLIDGAGAADLSFENVTLPEADCLLSGPVASAAIADAIEWTLAGLVVESAALCRAANRDTFAYLNLREQFGQKLVRFQALQHRAADMAIAENEATALANTVIAALGEPPSPARTRRVIGASIAADAAGRTCGHEAVQLHGGMGVSNELIISHYARRLTAIRNQAGSADLRVARLAALEGVTQ